MATLCGRAAAGYKPRMPHSLPPAFQRHVDACHSAVLPGSRLPFLIGAAPVGFVRPELAQALAGFPEITLADGQVGLAFGRDLPRIARQLSDRGLFRTRGEDFDVRDDLDVVHGRLDRGAVPTFGTLGWGVHLNGLVRRTGGLHLWVAIRAANKLLDPGKLDHITAGGVSAGMTPWQTLLKEAAEEAAIPPALARRAVPVGDIAYAMERPEGLRRDRLFCYDLDLPEDFAPRAADGEVASFELWPIERAFAAVRDGEGFKFNVNLVLIDLFQRQVML